MVRALRQLVPAEYFPARRRCAEELKQLVDWGRKGWSRAADVTLGWSPVAALGMHLGRVSGELQLERLFV